MFGKLPWIATIALALGASSCESTKAVNEAGQRLTVYRPGNESITQGDKGEVDVRVSRDQFDAPLRVEVDDLPEGVRLLNENLTIERHENKLTLSLVADPDAPVVVDHIVHVNVTGPDGLAAAESFRISVNSSH